MDKRKLRKVALPGDPDDPRGMHVRAREFFEWLRVHNYSELTVHNHEHDLRYFMQWCEERGVTRPNEVSLPVLERYQRWLYYYRKGDGHPLTFRTQKKRLLAVKALFRWLVRQHFVLANPAADLDLPKVEAQLPKHVLSASEAEAVLNGADVSTSRGVRDRAILETLYSTGMRRAELCRLKIYDLDVSRGTVMVRLGKGKKDRTLPIGARALNWIDKYLMQVRGDLVVEPDEGTLFLSMHGRELGPDRLSEIVRVYIEQSGIGKSGSCHLFRHTMATLMLENGADIRYVQQMLGHATLTSTEIYTHVSIRKLKAIHEATHPAKLERSDELAGGDEQTREELLASLADEADDEHPCAP